MADKQTFSVEIDFVAKNPELFDKANKQAWEAASAAKSVKNAYALYRDELKKLNPDLVAQIDAQKRQIAEMERAREVAKGLTLRMRELRAEAKEIRASVAIMRDKADDFDRFAKPLAAGGLAIAGGIFAFANKYVNDAKEATETTIAWKKAQDDLNKSGQKIGEILAQSALPLLQDAAVVTGKIAEFIERNPKVADAALKAGLISLALGSIGKAVSTGIKLVADNKLDATLGIQLEAARLQIQASANQLEAAGIQAATGGGINKFGGVGAAQYAPNAAGKGFATTLGQVTLIASSVVLGANIGLAIGNAINKAIDPDAATTTWKDIGDEAKKILAIGAGGVGSIVSVFDKESTAREKGLEYFGRAAKALGLLADSAEKASNKIGGPSFLGGSEETQGKLLGAYEKYKEADIELVKSHYKERQEIITAAINSRRAADENLSATLSGIARNAKKAEFDLTKDYTKQEIDAQQKYLDERRKIAQDGSAEILQIEQDSQERIAKLKQQFDERADAATRARNALALLDAKKDLTRGISEETQGANKEIARRRKDVALRLKELDFQFAQERAHRAAEYRDRIAEIEAQKKEQQAQARKAHEEEIKRIREDQAEKLKKLDVGFNEERLRRQKAFIAQINDLDKYLLGAYGMQVKYHAQMLAEFKQWIESMKKSIPTSSVSTTPVHDYTGYAYPGVYKMANNGQREFVLSGSDTRALEQRVGGSLNQNNITQGLFGARGGTVVQYSPRFDGTYTNEMRRAVQRDAEQVWETLLS